MPIGNLLRPSKKVTSDSLDEYIFNGLYANNYKVEVVSLLFSQSFSVATINNGNNNKDSYFNIATAGVSKSDVLTITNGEYKLNIACAIVPNSTVNKNGNRVWKDNNTNGKQDVNKNTVFRECKFNY